MKTKKEEASCNVVLDSRINRFGYSKVYFRIIQDRVKKDINTGIIWPADRFSKAEQILLPRYPDDQDVQAFNLRINEYKAVAHRLKLRGYLKSQTIGIEELLKEFKYIGKNIDFFRFMEGEIQYLFDEQVIAYPTWRRHRCTLNTIQKFWNRPSLAFDTITLDFIERFNAWAKKVHGKKHNTVAGYHKDFKKYLSRAYKQEIIAYNPYEDFSFKYVDGDRAVLEEAELVRLYKLLADEQLPRDEKEILTRFLFSCFTGLRISDSVRVKREQIINNTLVFVPYKTSDSNKILKIPVPEIAMSLIENRTGKLFREFSGDYINEKLKVLAARAGIYKRLTFHVARDTFGTLFIEMGGDVKSLQDLMGHESVKTTMIYLKMSDKRKAQLMDNFNKFLLV